MSESTSEPTWMNQTANKWQKAARLAAMGDNMGDALKYIDYAHCREMYENGRNIEEIQSRFDSQ